MLIYLMKEHGVRKVIASPGSTNVTFVASIQQDPYFEIYSSVDERSAAYMACGLAAESGEPVALSCTGATASRNYVPGLTEAYYRKLPVLAITSTQHMGQTGQYVPQVIDRTQLPNDIAKLSVQIPIIHDDVDEWTVNVALNNALLELRHHGGGPVHINITTSYPFYSANFSTRKLPVSRSIFRIVNEDELPSLENKQIAIFVGNHIVWNSQLTDAVDYFCEQYNAVVWCDYTSNYTGKYGVSASLVTSQDLYKPDCISPDVVIHIGEVSGAYLASDNHCRTPLGERTKTLKVAKTFLKYRVEDLERILSDDGTRFRIKRSIQAECSFGDEKQDMQFRRYLCKGTSDVLVESTLLAMAKIINKLHNKIQKGRTGTHVFPLKSA